MSFVGSLHGTWVDVAVMMIACLTEMLAFLVVAHRPWQAIEVDNRLRATKALPPALYHQHQLYSNYDIQHELRPHVAIQQVAEAPYKPVQSTTLVYCFVHRPYYSLRREILIKSQCLASIFLYPVLLFWFPCCFSYSKALGCKCIL